jgi:hypothetical protein
MKRTFFTVNNVLDDLKLIQATCPKNTIKKYKNTAKERTQPTRLNIQAILYKNGKFGQPLTIK